MKILNVVLLLILSIQLLQAQKTRKKSNVEIGIVISKNNSRVTIPVQKILKNQAVPLVMPKKSRNDSKVSVIITQEASDKKTDYSKLIIGYELDSNGSLYEGALVLTDENATAGNVIYSLFPYKYEMDRFIRDDINFKITFLQIDDLVMDSIPHHLDLKLRVKASKVGNSYRKLCDFLSENNIYPNRAAFDVLFQANPQLFGRDQIVLSRLSEANLELLKPKIQTADLTIDSFFIPVKQKNNEAVSQCLKKWVEMSKNIKLHYLPGSKKTELQRIAKVEEILEHIKGGRIRVSRSGLNLLLANCELIIFIIERAMETKGKMESKLKGSYNLLFEDIDKIIRSYSRNKFSLSFLDPFPPDILFASKDVLKPLSSAGKKIAFSQQRVRSLPEYILIVNTLEKKPELSPKKDLYVKAMPLAHRKTQLHLGASKYKDKYGDNFIFPFIDPSSPSFQYLEPGYWFLWAEDGEQIVSFAEPPLDIETARTEPSKDVAKKTESIRVRLQEGEDEFRLKVKYFTAIIQEEK